MINNQFIRDLPDSPKRMYLNARMCNCVLVIYFKKNQSHLKNIFSYPTTSIFLLPSFFHHFYSNALAYVFLRKTK